MLGRFRTRRLSLEGALSEVESQPMEIPDEYGVRIGDGHHRVRVLNQGPGRRVALVDHRVVRLAVVSGRGCMLVSRSGDAREVELDVPSTATNRTRVPPLGSGDLIAPMPGRVLAVQVTAGQTVERGAPLVLIEAMKMQNQLSAASAGVVSSVLVQAGAVVERGAVLVRIG